MDFRIDSEVVRVNVPSKRALTQQVKTRLSKGDGFALATINLDHLVKLSTSSVFRKAYCAQDLVVADGNPIVWLSRLARRPVELVPGSDVVMPLTQVARDTNAPIAIVGSTDEVLQKAADKMCEDVAGLQVNACISPKFGFDPEGPEADRIFDALNASGAKLCFIALGAPKQEIFAARAREKCPGIGFASVGAGIDFIAGGQNRAPSWVRQLAMEWVWRMLSSPKRLGPRYAKCMAILPVHVMKALRLRWAEGVAT